MSLFRRRGFAGRAENLALFRRAGANVAATGDLLAQLLVRWPDDEGLRREILLREQDGDRITEEIANTVRDPEAIALASAVDDVVDYAEEAADLLGLYQIEAPMDQAQDLSAVLRDATATLGRALDSLDDAPALRSHLRDIHRLENDGDRMSRDGLAALFAGGIDPVLIIRWKDIFERIEHAIDACEQAANVMHGIALRYR